MFINKAPQILAQAIRSVIIEENRLREVFRHNNPDMANLSNDMNKEDLISNSDEDFPFNHGLSYR